MKSKIALAAAIALATGTMLTSAANAAVCFPTTSTRMPIN